MSWCAFIRNLLVCIVWKNNGPRRRFVYCDRQFCLKQSVFVVYQRSSSQYASAPQQQQQPMPGGTFFQDSGVPFSSPDVSNMMNDPMATAAIHYGSHLAQSGGQYMQQNVRNWQMAYN